MQQMTKVKGKINPRISNKFSERDLALLQKAATDRGIVGSYAIARYIRRVVAEALEADGYKMEEA
jgi:hypothetical protein